MLPFSFFTTGFNVHFRGGHSKAFVAELFFYQTASKYPACIAVDLLPETHMR